ncbi:DNA-binding protein [Mycobacterium sp. TY815]|uniref:DNA-binding protein n=1 Tax=Mycobacterium sp. TY815 TaxID=3050581 RepID=UPI00274152A6|nr:DNA-binding protein [Mycobacterium sp. TY815]MDP7703351.1 DNA-binding protein [Mycobacterium sp. TY815]
MTQIRHAKTDTTALTVRLPVELAEALKNYAFVTETSGNDVVKRALLEYLQVHGRQDLMRSAFERVMEQHREALEKLKDL